MNKFLIACFLLCISGCTYKIVVSSYGLLPSDKVVRTKNEHYNSTRPLVALGDDIIIQAVFIGNQSLVEPKKYYVDCDKRFKSIFQLSIWSSENMVFYAGKTTIRSDRVLLKEPEVSVRMPGQFNDQYLSVDSPDVLLPASDIDYKKLKKLWVKHKEYHSGEKIVALDFYKSLPCAEEKFEVTLFFGKENSKDIKEYKLYVYPWEYGDIAR